MPTNYPFILVSLVQLTKYSQPAGASLDMCHSLMRINWPIILIVQSNWKLFGNRLISRNVDAILVCYSSNLPFNKLNQWDLAYTQTKIKHEFLKIWFIKYSLSQTNFGHRLNYYTEYLPGTVYTQQEILLSIFFPWWDTFCVTKCTIHTLARALVLSLQ